MTLSVFASLFIVTLLGTMTLGQSVIMVSHHTLASGRVNGVITACSHAIGVGIYAILSLSGLALTLKNSPLVFHFIAYSGAAYLFLAKNVPSFLIRRQHYGRRFFLRSFFVF